jgi:hypothetical protein
MKEIDDLTQFPAEMSDMVLDFEAFKLESTNHDLMNHLVIGFPNGYGMSIIQSAQHYSDPPETWELGIARWHVGVDAPEWGLIEFEEAEELLGLCDQVVGWQTPAELLAWAKRLAALPPQD